VGFKFPIIPLYVRVELVLQLAEIVVRFADIVKAQPITLKRKY
jgi:hypothetical protein